VAAVKGKQVVQWSNPTERRD